MNQQFRGTGVALVTPFNEKGGIDFTALNRTINHVIDGEVEYVVTLGTTGESVTLNMEEKRKVLDFTIEKVAKRVPIVAGFGGNNTYQTAAEIRDYHFDGIDAILSASPAYNKPPQEGIYKHFMTLAEAAPRPIILYNVPGRTSSNMEAETTLKLAAQGVDTFCAIKEASGDMAQAAKILKHKPSDFMVLSGDDPTALPLISMGGEGVISVIANALPKLFSDMIRAGLNNDLATASSLHLQVSDIHYWLYKEGNPAGIKAAMELLDVISKHTRLPLLPLSEPSYIELKKELEKAGVLEMIRT